MMRLQHALFFLLVLALSVCGNDAWMIHPTITHHYTTNVLDELPITMRRRAGPPPFSASSSEHHHLLTNSRQDSYSSSHHKRSTTALSATTSSAPSGSLLCWLLPSCPPTGVVRVATVAGLVGVVSQWILYQLFRRQRSNEVRRETAGYTAHSVVALGLMLLVSWIGSVGWFFGPHRPATAYDRLVSSDASKLLPHVGPVRWLAAVIVGMFAAWDIPTSLRVKRLRKLDLLVHHVAMMLIALLGATLLPMHYIYFYFGVSELSSIPLVIYDQLEVDCEVLGRIVHNKKKTDKNDKNRARQLERWRQRRNVMGVVAALLFTLVRAVGFTWVTLRQFLPDCLAVLATTTPVVLSNNKMRWIIKGIMAASVAFTILQLYWFSTILQVIFGTQTDPDDDERESLDALSM